MKQLQGGKVEPERQVKNAKVGIVHRPRRQPGHARITRLGGSISEYSDNRGRSIRKVKPFLDELEAKPFSAHLSESTNLRRSAVKLAANYSRFRRKAPAHTAFHRITTGCPSAAKAKSILLSATTAPGIRPTKESPLQRFVSRSRRGNALDQQRHRLSARASQIGMPVEVVYEDNEDYTLPKFRPVK